MGLLLGEEIQQREKARYRTGTGPFMAINLLDADAIPPNQYRHDLESFFWVLTWFVATHNPIQHTLGRINEWLNADLNAVYDAKRMFLRNLRRATKILSKGSPRYKSIKSTCITPLIKTFRALETEGQTVEDLHDNLLGHIVSNNRASANQCLVDIRRRMNDRNLMVSFRLFMDLLL